MQPIYVSKSLVAASANNIAQSQTPGGAGNLTLNGSTVVGGVAVLDTSRQVLITQAASEVGHTFTVYGEGEGGVALQEAVAGSAGASVATTQSFKKVTRVAVSAATTGAVQVGTNTVGSSRWIQVSADLTPVNIALAVLVAGTVNFTVNYTYEDPSGTYPNPATAQTVGYQTTPTGPLIAAPTAFAITALSAKAATTDGGNLTTPVTAVQLQINSGTGTAVLVILQAGIAGN